MKFKKAGRLVGASVALILAGVMITNLFAPTVVEASADSVTYKDSLELGNVYTTANTGQIWTDMSVLDKKDQYVDDNRITLNEGEAFNVIYSAMGLNMAIGAENPGELISSDYITFTMPLGKFMDVKEVKDIIYQCESVKFGAPVKEGNITTYTGQGTVTDKITGEEKDFSSVILTLDETDPVNKIVQIKLPKNMVPSQIDYLTMDSNGKPSKKTTKETTALRVVFSVGVDEELIQSSGTHQAYEKDHAQGDQIEYYANRYTGQQDAEGKMIGDATTEFTPSKNNPTYYYQQDKIIYTDKNLKVPMTTDQVFDSNSTYYVENSYYNGLNYETAEEEIKGTTAVSGQSSGLIVEKEGSYVIKAGTPRFDYIEQNLSKEKMKNETGTAQMVNDTEVVSAVDEIVKIVVHHGNNGITYRDAMKSLSIKLAPQEGTPAPLEQYEFNVTIPYKSHSSADAKLVSSEGEESYPINFDINGSTKVTIGKDQTLVIPYVSGEYQVTPLNEGEGVKITAPNDGKGQIESKKDEIVEFKVAYNPVEVQVDAADLGFPITYYNLGEAIRETDEFSFEITSSDNENAYAQNNVVTISGSEAAGKNTVDLDFGKFTFKQSGTYEFLIRQNTQEPISGYRYDHTLYKVKVLVSDDGKGVLFMEDHGILKGEKDFMIDIDKMVYTNEYTGDRTETDLIGKYIFNYPGTNPFYPDVSFKIEKDGTHETQPMPKNVDENGVIKQGKSAEIDFGKISFNADHIGNTYTYYVTEVQPTEDGTYEGNPLPGAEKDKDGNFVYKGLHYDKSKKEIVINVTDDNGAPKITVTGNYFDFTNSYTTTGGYSFGYGQSSGIVAIQGRKFVSDDLFEIEVTSANLDPSFSITKDQELKKNVKFKPGEGATEFEVDFGEVTFDENDIGKTFVYTFKLKEGSQGGLSYDTNVKKVLLTVKDNFDGTLSIEKSGDPLNWDLKYRADEMTSGIDIVGMISVENKEMEVGRYAVEIEPVDGAPLSKDYNGNPISTSLNGVKVDERYINHEASFNILKNLRVTSEDMGGEAERNFQYIVKQKVPDLPIPGMKYDDSVYRLTLNTKDDLHGIISHNSTNSKIEKLDSEGSWFEVQDIEFKNIYQVNPVSITPFEIDKQPMLKVSLTGTSDGVIEKDKFKYSFALTNAEPSDGIEITNNKVVGNQAGSDSSANIFFKESKVKFTKEGTYIFAVTQEALTDDTITNVTPQIEVTYTVENVDGNLVATPSFTGDVKDGIFINEYKTSGIFDVDEQGHEYLEVEQILNGKEWSDQDSFDFVLSANDEITKKAIEDGDIVLTKDRITIDQNTKEHKAGFGAVTFNKAGSYQFTVFEDTKGLQPGVQPDGSERIVYITATNLENGTLGFECEIKDKNNLIFTKEYKTDLATLIGKDNLSVTKELTGRDWLESDSFSFTLSGADKSTQDAIGTKVFLSAKGQEETVTITKQSLSYTENFGNITFTEAGSYVFDVQENDPAITGVSYVTEPKKIYVDVTDAAGALQATVNTQNSDELHFVNEYSATKGILTGQSDLVVTKELTGREWMEGENFTFELQPSNESAKDINLVKMPEQTSIVVDSTTKTNYFGDIEFYSAGTYEFEIKEILPEGVNDSDAGLHYDLKPRKIIVNVEDDLAGNLTVVKDVENSDTLAFVNQYIPTPLVYSGAENLKVQKNIDGRDWRPGDEFTFVLNRNMLDSATEEAYIAGDFTMPQQSGGLKLAYDKDNTDGIYMASFGDIVFNKAGEYQFEIREIPGSITGITYDVTPKQFTISVTDDGYGNLVASSNEMVTFTNAYCPESVVFEDKALTVSKKVNGREWKKNDKFEFSISPIKAYEAGSFDLLSDNCEINADMDSKVASFKGIKFYKPSPKGGYQFLVREEGPDLKEGLSYDKRVKRVAVNVEDINGKLEATVNTGKTDSLVFENTYNSRIGVFLLTVPPEQAEYLVGIPVTTTLTGREWNTTDEFKFKIEPLDGAPQMPYPTSVISSSDGWADFGVLRIGQEDMGGETFKTFRYKVTQEIPEPKLPGITYDESEKIISFKVKDNGEGYIVAENYAGKNETDNSRKMVFENVYTAKEAVLSGKDQLQVVNSFEGRDWTETDEFTFQLSAGDALTEDAVKNGKIVLPENASAITLKKEDSTTGKAFGDIIFKNEGTYSFDVQIINQDLKNVVYADKQTIVVDVANQADQAQLTATVKEDAKLQKFQNQYISDGAVFSGMSAQVVINGRDWIDGESFECKIGLESPDANIILPAGTSVIIDDQTKDHKAEFENIIFKKAGEYKIPIIKKRISPDKVPTNTTEGTSEQIVTVTVTEQDGVLLASADIDEVIFTDEYKAEPVILSSSDSLMPEVKMHMSDDYAWPQGDFVFRMSPANELAQKVTLPGNLVFNKYYENVYGIGKFSELKFAEPGIYEFYVNQIIPEDDQRVKGMQYDQSVQKISITVEDDKEGTLKVKESTKMVVFTNAWQNIPTVVKGDDYLKVNKKMLMWPEGVEFKIRMEPTEETIQKNQGLNKAYEFRKGNEITITENNRSSAFGDIIFYKAGTYEFDIYEVNTGIKNVTYDTSKYRIVIAVYGDEYRGELRYLVSNINMDGFSSDAAYFTNTYTPTPYILSGEDNLLVEKKLTGREWVDEDSFIFTIKDHRYASDDDYERDRNEKVVLDKNHKQGHFGDIKFKKPGMYKFILSEEIPEEDKLNGIEYAVPQTFYINIGMNQNGDLYLESIDEKLHTFKNIYVAKDAVLNGEENLQVQKVFNGRSEWLDTDQFTFEIAPKGKQTEQAVTDNKIIMNNTKITIDKNSYDPYQGIYVSNFDDITFKEQGTYTFEITEEIPKDAPKNLVYDTAKKTITVEVSDDLKGSLVATIIEGDQTSVFTNTYKEIKAVLEGKDNLIVEKKLTGRDWSETDEFTFNIIPDMSDEATMNAINDGKIEFPNPGTQITLRKDKTTDHFGDIVFRRIGNYKLIVSEVVPADAAENGMIYANPQKVNVQVVGNDEGTLTATVDSTTLTFENKYQPKAAQLDGTELTVQKVFNGKEWTDEEFTFNLVPTNDSVNSPDIENGTQSIVITKDDIEENGITGEGLGLTSVASKTFGNITFSKVGTYTFEITEEIPEDAPKNLEYDTAKKTITVEVSDDLKGSLAAKIIEGDQTSVFTNTYAPESIVVGPNGTEQIEMSKVLTGRPMTEDDKWTFTIARTDESEVATPIPDQTEVVNLGDQIVFGDITYTAPGVYKYLVTESGEIPGVTNDTGSVQVTVTVTYDPVKGEFAAEVSYEKDGEASQGNNAFINTYQSTPGILSGETYLNVKKILSGRDWMESDQFTFNMSADPEDEFTVQAVNAKKLVLPEDITINADSTDSEGGKKANFADISFAEAGIYKFVITENDTGIPGIVYDTIPKKVVVTVEEDLTKGTISAKANVTNVSFENTYRAKSVTLAADQTFAFSKKLVGRDWTDQDVFTFDLTALEDGIPMPEKTQAEVGKPASGNQNSFDFGTITYTVDDMQGANLVNGVKVKNFSYNITEAVPAKTNGIKYDSATRKVTVTIVDDGSGQLELQGAVIVEGDKTFTNTYSSSIDYGTVSQDNRFTITKNLKDHDLITDQFEFTITGTDDRSKAKLNEVGGTDGVLKIKNSGATAVGGTATWSVSPFDEMTFVKTKDLDETGTYSYTVSENSADQKPGYTYDTTVYNTIITVEDDGTGLLSVSTEGADAVFNNAYKATGTLGNDVKIHATKTLNGRAMKAGEFNFEVINLQNDSIVATGSNIGTSNGSAIDFTNIDYATDTIEDSGYAQKAISNGNTVYTYSYLVKEKTPTTPSVTAKTGEFTISVKVTDDEAGNLIPEVEYPQDSTSLDFVNEYAADVVTLDVNASKVLIADDAELTLGDIAGKFTFTLQGVSADYEPLVQDTDINGSGSIEIPMPENVVMTNDATGNISFGTISYDLALFDKVAPKTDGTREITFTYSVTESNSVTGITNDPNATKNFTVKVVEDGEGVITATKTGDVRFVNEYHYDPVVISPTSDGTLNVIAKMQGRTLKEAELQFELKDVGGNVVATGSNAADGTVTLEAVTLAAPGEYNFTLYQVHGGETLDNGVTYDPAVYEIKAQVSDNKDGTLNAVWSSDEGNQLEYVDVYKAAPTAVSLEAVEVLTGRELKDGEFSFLLKDKDGNVLQTVQNDAKGQIKLKKIKYDKVGETTYTLEQVKGEEKNMQYDDTVYEITVQVTDDELGHLIPEITIKDAQSMVFHNEYTEPEKPSDQDKKPSDQDKKPDEDKKGSDEAGTSPDKPGVNADKEEANADKAGTSSDKAGTSPRTGDASSVALWLILAMVSLSGIEVCIRMKKNRNI